jgi:hypothetical protein
MFLLVVGDRAAYAMCNRVVVAHIRYPPSPLLLILNIFFFAFLLELYIGGFLSLVRIAWPKR